MILLLEVVVLALALAGVIYLFLYWLRQKAELEREAAEREVSRSEYIRSILDDRHRAGELDARLATREDRVDELEAQLARRSQVEEKMDVLAKRVEDSEAPDPPFPIRWWRWWRTRDDGADAG